MNQQLLNLLILVATLATICSALPAVKNADPIICKAGSIPNGKRCDTCKSGISVFCPNGLKSCPQATSDQPNSNNCVPCPDGYQPNPDKKGKCMTCAEGTTTCDDSGSTSCAIEWQFVNGAYSNRLKKGLPNTCTKCSKGMHSPGGIQNWCT